MSANTEVCRFEVTSHLELAGRGALIIGRLLGGVIRPGMWVYTNSDPPTLRVAGIEFVDNVRERKSWNALMFAERPNMNFVKAAFPVGSIIDILVEAQPFGLIEVLRDDTARIDERDDAAMCLADYDQPEAERALLDVALDPLCPDVVLWSCGASLAEIWCRTRAVLPGELPRLPAAAQAEARGIISARRPEWLR